MPRRDAALRLRDILKAIRKIEAHVAGMDFESFSEDEKTIDAVLHNLAVLGEAVGHLPPAVLAMAPQLPWDEMRGMRNVVVHEYFGVALSVIWQTIQVDLPSLISPLENIIRMSRQGAEAS